MKRCLIVAAFFAATTPALAENVGVSISVGQPGFYGRIDILDFPQPQLVYSEPVVVQAVPVNVRSQPIYLHVPPGHAKDWRKHCRKYNACSQRGYFVQESWYNDVFVPRYRERKQDGKGHDKKHGKGKGHKND